MHDDFPVIFTENLTKSYEKGSIKALDGVNLVIERGDFVSIIGPSGSGKSSEPGEEASAEEELKPLPRYRYSCSW